ncbi:MAG: (Fe-S)-binding protein [Thermodesulfobacteriota bacterium]
MEQSHDFIKQFGEQVRQCSRCGFCQAYCPVFGATLRPALNARGKMLILQEVMEGALPLSGALAESLYQCTTCASCSVNCRSGVKVPEIVKLARRDLVRSGIEHPVFQALRGVLAEGDNIYAETRPVDQGRPRRKKAEVVFFLGCVGLFRQPAAATAALDLLDHLKVDYTMIDEACCGGVLEDLGYNLNPRLVEQNVEAILATGARTVLTGCPYCLRTFRERAEYKPLRDRGLNLLPLSRFWQDFDFGVKSDLKVTYHDPCDLGRHGGFYDEPRQVIKKIAPDFVEMAHCRVNALCCGAGGGVKGAYPKNSLAMARRRLEEAEAVGAQVVLTECNSCLHNLASAKRVRQKFKVMTLAQFINHLRQA